MLFPAPDGPIMAVNSPDLNFPFTHFRIVLYPATKLRNDKEKKWKYRCVCSSIIKNFIRNADYVAGNFHNIFFFNAENSEIKTFQAHHCAVRLEKNISNVLLDFAIKSDTICISNVCRNGLRNFIIETVYYKSFSILASLIAKILPKNLAKIVIFSTSLYRECIQYIHRTDETSG